jgi:hypothetical protein
LVSHGLTYLLESPGVVHHAVPADGGGFVVNATVVAVKYAFEQTKWNKVDCRIELWASDQGERPSLNNLARKAMYLSRQAALLSAEIHLANGYDDATELVAAVNAHASYFYESVQSGTSRQRLASLLSMLKTQVREFEMAFIPIHVRIRNATIELAWSEFTSALDGISLN